MAAFRMPINNYDIKTPPGFQYFTGLSAKGRHPGAILSIGPENVAADNAELMVDSDFNIGEPVLPTVTSLTNHPHRFRACFFGLLTDMDVVGDAVMYMNMLANMLANMATGIAWDVSGSTLRRRTVFRAPHKV
ncbi:hypothetical protein [uncultured Tateyamaria sp.]|uniref:hypothetical protein n=1 Tax=uncultured Tateyamaria sp. TaxID=455651 RepID=UPI00260EFDC5|nr:hypothetical protein [uncultured Tateyamaria sp.]